MASGRNANRAAKGVPELSPDEYERADAIDAFHARTSREPASSIGRIYSVNMRIYGRSWS